MAEHPSNALTMLTEFLSAEHIEATGRQTGFVQRPSKITGHLSGPRHLRVWRDAKTMPAQLAAKVPPLSQHVAVSPEAIYQRMNKRALDFLQALIRQRLPSSTPVKKCLRKTSLRLLPECTSLTARALNSQTV